MATERRYLKGDVVQVLRSLYENNTGRMFRVAGQLRSNGVVFGWGVDYTGEYFKRYANQVKLVKRPWWNWLRLPFVKKVVRYERSMAR